MDHLIKNYNSRRAALISFLDAHSHFPRHATAVDKQFMRDLVMQLAFLNNINCEIRKDMTRQGDDDQDDELNMKIAHFLERLS